MSETMAGSSIQNIHCQSSLYNFAGICPWNTQVCNLPGFASPKTPEIYYEAALAPMALA
jgi:hypothetical protein